MRKVIFSLLCGVIFLTILSGCKIADSGVLKADSTGATAREGISQKHQITPPNIEKESENMIKSIINTGNAPEAIGPYSQGVKLGDLVFVSGQLPIDPATGIMAEGISEQTRQSLQNVKAILEEAGVSLEKVVKTTVFLKDMNEFAGMNEVYKEFFKGDYPARSTVQVARLPKDASVEIEVIASF